MAVVRTVSSFTQKRVVHIFFKKAAYQFVGKQPTAFLFLRQSSFHSNFEEEKIIII